MLFHIDLIKVSKVDGETNEGPTTKNEDPHLKKNLHRQSAVDIGSESQGYHKLGDI